MVLRFVSLLFQFKQTRKTMDGESIESDKKAICESKRNFICFNGRLQFSILAGLDQFAQTRHLVVIITEKHFWV